MAQILPILNFGPLKVLLLLAHKLGELALLIMVVGKVLWWLLKMQTILN